MAPLVSPRPAGSRRVQAGQKRRLEDAGASNCARKLLRRELGLNPAVSFTRNSAAERFRNFRLQGNFDSYDAAEAAGWRHSFLRKRSRVVEIVAAKDIMFALVHSGVCAAFDRDTKKRICYMNQSPDEVIRSLFYNKNNNSIITVSVYASDNYSSLNCRTTPLEYVRRGKPHDGFCLFEGEALRWPGFVEFDDVNGKILTYSAADRLYKVFDLKNYAELYRVSDEAVQEVKISPGIMLLIMERQQDHVPLKIMSIQDGTILKEFQHPLCADKKVDFIEQFNEKLLVKQEGENLQIVDVQTGGLTEVSCEEFLTPTAFIFLYENQLFLTFRNRTVAVWNFKGERVTSFDDHLLWYPDCQTNNIYITSDQDLIISYCKETCTPECRTPSVDSRVSANPSIADTEFSGRGPADDAVAGTINISNILNGRCLAKISALRELDGKVDPKIQEALSDVTALFFDEERNEIYTGNKGGILHSWSN